MTGNHGLLQLECTWLSLLEGLINIIINSYFLAYSFLDYSSLRNKNRNLIPVLSIASWLNPLTRSVTGPYKS